MLPKNLDFQFLLYYCKSIFSKIIEKNMNIFEEEEFAVE